jgi:hypothetical protein
MGLNRFNPQTRKFVRYFKSDGLADDIICALAFDRDSILWVTTNSGITRFDYKNQTFRSFSKWDGLQGNEFSQKSILRLTDGSILAGGKNGFNLISPWLLTQNTLKPNVVITDLLIANQKITPAASGSPLKKQITESDLIILKYKQSVLTFKFSALDFTNPQKNKYAYMIENFDENWIQAGNRSEATYTNLSPGSYILRVKASNNDGVWNEKGTSIKIIVTPPWWKRKLAYFLYILFTIGLFAAFYKIRVTELEKQKQILARLVEERTKELAAKNDLLQSQALHLKKLTRCSWNDK